MDSDEGKRLDPTSSTLSTSSDLFHPAPEVLESFKIHNEDFEIGTSTTGLNQTFPVVENGDGRSGSGTSPATTQGEADIAGNGIGPSSSLSQHPSHQLNGSKNGDDSRAHPTTTQGEANVQSTGQVWSHSMSDCYEASMSQAGVAGPAQVVPSQVASNFIDKECDGDIQKCAPGPAQVVHSQVDKDFEGDIQKGDAGPPVQVVPSQLVASNFTEKDFQGGCRPKNEQSSDGLEGSADEVVVAGHSDPTTQYPPPQVMERPNDPGSSPYRIPDHVFSKKSNALMEWSTASNESLFSIQMGNMSFTRDQFPWKSGELGLHSELNMPSPLIDYSSNQPPSKQAAEISQKNETLNGVSSPTVIQEKAAETMREVIMENTKNVDKETASPPPKGKYHSPCLSHASDGSTKSFAFPILAGEGERSGSLRVDTGKKKSSSPPQPPPSKDESQPQTPKETPNATQTPKSTMGVVKQKWVSCFYCCPFCN